MGTTTGQLMATAASYPDYIVIGLVLILFGVYGFLRGSKAISELALSLPLAAFVYVLLPYSFSWGAPAVFAVLAVASAWVISRYTSGLDDDKDFSNIALASVGATGLLLVIINGIVDFTALYIFSSPITDFFANNTYKFYVLVVSLVATALSRKV